MGPWFEKIGLKNRDSIYSLKTGEKESRERHRAFWRNESLGVPLVYAVAERHDHVMGEWTTPARRKDWDLCPAWHLHMVRNHLEGTVFLADAMPMASLMVGLDITNSAVLAGGDYDYCSTSECVIFLPGTSNLDDPIPGFNHDHPLAKGLLDCYQAVIEYTGHQACVNTPMTLDALSSLYSLCPAENFLVDLVRSPQRIMRRAEELTALYLEFYDYFYDFLLNHGYGESASWFQVFAEGKFESVRCDFSVMLSEETFRRVVVPEIRQVCDHMDYSLFNMCSVKHARFSDALSEIGTLNGVFWNPEPYLDGIRSRISALRHIKSKGLCLEIVCQTVEEAVLATRELGPDGLYLFFENKFPSVPEAEAALEAVYKACRR